MFNSVESNRIQTGPVKLVITVAEGLHTLEQTKAVSETGETNSNKTDISECNKRLVKSLENAQFSSDLP